MSKALNLVLSIYHVANLKEHMVASTLRRMYSVSNLMNMCGGCNLMTLKHL